MTFPVSVDVKLGADKFDANEDSPHVVLRTDPDKQVLEVLIKTCPAGLYKKQDSGNVCSDYAECLECGTCRILGLDTAPKRWEYPRGTFSVRFRYG